MAISYQPGDFIVTEGHYLQDKLIQLTTHSPWNHVALLINEAGDLIEVYPKGIKKGSVADFKDKRKYIVRINLTDADRKHVLDYANYMITHHASYDFFAFVSIGLKILLKSKIILKVDRSVTCSEFVALALAQGGIIWPKDPALITPADLYTYFQPTNSFLEGNYQILHHTE